MQIRKDVLHARAFLVAAATAAVAATTLFVPVLLYDRPLSLEIRIICPLLFFIGLAGSLFGSRLFRIFGWLGIPFYLLYAIAMILPGEEYMFGGPGGPPLSAPHLPSVLETSLRFVLLMTLIAVLIASYIKVGRLLKRHKQGVTSR
jgi:hypothetical protein